MSKQKFKISVVMPIYNTENYLGDAIESVINQTIGFKDNIQLILVNDGSIDGSKDICLKYREIYSDNIVYIEQKNSGVSVARNNGIKSIKGEYVNFMDSDDKWALNAFEIAYNYLTDNKDLINFAICRIKFFGRTNGYGHILDYRFSKTRIVDIFGEYQCINKAVNNVFVKSDLIVGGLFNPNLKYAEDMKFITEIMINNKIYNYGIIKEAEYLYRKREEQNSALDKQLFQRSNYIEISEDCFLPILNGAKKVYKNIPEYYQYLVMHDLQFRIKTNLSLALDKKEIELFNKYVKEILGFIEDYIIMSVKNISVEQKIKLFELKHSKDLSTDLRYTKGKLYFNNIDIYNLGGKNLLKIDFINIENNSLHIEGRIKYPFDFNNIEIYVRNNNNTYKVEYFGEELDNQLFMGEKFLTNRYFKVDVPLEKNNLCVKFFARYKDYYIKKLGLNLALSSHLNLENQYVKQNDNVIFIKSNKIIVKTATLKQMLVRKLKFLKFLFKKKKYKSLLYRFVYNVCNLFKRKPVWIVTDRPYVAGDNGEAFFEYVVKHEKKANVYFAIRKDSEDYNRLKKVGKVLNYGSKRYKIKFLLSDLIISSQADDWVVNAFGKGRSYLSDLYNFKFVFLQHGITKDDLSDWLKKVNKDIKIFVTAAIPEYESILKGKYSYSNDVVKLTGFPRYDKLHNNPKKKIDIMPTWRMPLAGVQDKSTGKRIYSDTFKDSEYFKFYNNLINDERLIECLKKHDYIGEIFIHPSHSEQVMDYQCNEVIKVHDGITNYNKEFSEASLLITDYSSVAFDFAYLKKPVIYSQFDKKEFFGSHIYKEGYFSYEDDGFGPVCYDYESTVNAIIKAIENDCKNDQKYIKRIHKFFKYTDKNNSKRVYEEIKKLK